MERGMKVTIQIVYITCPSWTPCPYMVKTFKIFFSGIERPMTMKLGTQHHVLEYYQVCSNNAPGLTMTYFTARSNLVPYILVWETIKTMEFSEWKTMEFSETVVVYDIKVCRYSQLNGYMKHYEYQRTR